jgi:putative DNA primase/helicase
MNDRDYERARSALAFIPPDDRDMWVSMGMSIKDGFGDAGFDLWNAWSRQSGRYNERDARDVWRSIKAGGGITLGTLFHEAKARGWRDDGTYQKPTPEEIEARRREAAERTAKEEARSDREHTEAASKALAIWKAATPAPGDHPYLVRKCVRAHGLRLYRGSLVVRGMPCDVR